VLTVKLTFPGDCPLARQTPGHTAVWNNCRFLINQPVKECDYWVVYEHIDQAQTTLCPPDNTLLITGEPPSVRDYSPKFVGQFGSVLTCHTELPSSDLILGQQGLPWHVGRRQWGHENLSWSKDYDELKSIDSVKKTRLLSVISSDKAFTPGHRARREFVARLKEHFGERIDVFGRGTKEIEDKWDALAPYQYHLALENCSCPHYWTEKLSDTFLAYCHPIYGGCPNVDDYFPEGSLTSIDVSQPESAIETIEACLENELWESSRQLIVDARELVLNKYNLFPMIAELVEERVKSTNAAPVRVTIGPDLPWKHRVIRFLGRVKRTGR
jgi:hypothetical protein